MRFEPVPPGQQANPPNDDNAGLRSKLGGTPDWIQPSSKGTTIVCDHCKDEATFVAQIDSIEHQPVGYENPNAKRAPERDYMFADVGMIYIFWCFRCCAPKCVYEC